MFIDTTVPTSVAPSTSPVSNTSMTTTSETSVIVDTATEEQFEIAPGVFVDKETYEIIKGADAQAIRPTRNVIPEIKVVATDKQVLEFSSLLGKGIQKGTFISISYDENGDKFYTDLGVNFTAVILKNTNAYSLYDETEGKSTHYTNEFEFGVQNRIMLKRQEDNRVLFDGVQKDLKGFLLTNFPGKTSSEGRQTHQFSFRNIIYVVLPELIKERGPGAVFRLMLSHTSLDGINDFKKTISGDAMKYLADFSTIPKLVGGNLAYPLQVRVAGDIIVLAKLGVVSDIAKMKRDLDDMIHQIQEHFFTDVEAHTQNTPKVSVHVNAAPETPAPILGAPTLGSDAESVF